MCITITKDKDKNRENKISIDDVVDFVNHVSNIVEGISDSQIQETLKNNECGFEALKVIVLLYIIKKHVYNNNIEEMEKDLEEIFEYLGKDEDENKMKIKIDSQIFKGSETIIKINFKDIICNDTIIEMSFKFLNSMSIIVDNDFKFTIWSYINMMTMVNDRIIESLNEINRLDLYNGNLIEFSKNLKKLSFNELVKFIKHYFDGCLNTIENLTKNLIINTNKKTEEHIKASSEVIVTSVLCSWINDYDLNLLCKYILDYYKNKDFSKIRAWLALKYISNVEIFKSDEKTDDVMITDKTILVSKFFRAITKFNLNRFFDDEQILDLVYYYVKKICIKNVYACLSIVTDNPFNFLFSIIYLFLNPNLLKFINLFSKKKNIDKNSIIKEIIKEIYYFEIKISKINDKIKNMKQFIKEFLGDNYIDVTLKIVTNIIDSIESLKTVFNEEKPDLNVYNPELTKNIIEYVNKNNLSIIISIISTISKNNKEIVSTSLGFQNDYDLERLKQIIFEIHFCFDGYSPYSLPNIGVLMEKYRETLSGLYSGTEGNIGS